MHIGRLPKAYRVAATPLREALSKLTSLDLVTSQGQRGFRVAPGSIENHIAVTRMQCGPELMKEEASFLHALQAARFHSVEGDRLTLIDESGAPRLRLVHLSRPDAAGTPDAGFIGPRFTRGLPAQ